MADYSPDNRVISRRTTLVALGAAGVSFSTRALSHPDSSLMVSGIPADLVLTGLTSTILRLSLVPAASRGAALTELNNDPVLELISQGRLLMNEQSVGSSQVLTWSNRRVRVTGSPITVEVQDENGRHSVVAR